MTSQHTEQVVFPVIQAKALRFTLTTPDHGGLMLDQLRLRAAVTALVTMVRSR